MDCGKCTAVCPVSKYNPKFSPRLIVQKALRNQDRLYSDADIWSCIGCNICSMKCNYNVNYVDFIRYLRTKSRDNGAGLTFSHSGVTESIMHLMGKQEIKQNRLDWIPRDILLDESCDTAFFVGCAPYFDIIFANIGVKPTDSSTGAMRLLNLATVPYKVLPDERCCGHDLILAGDFDGFLKLVNANVEEFKRRGIKKIITSCPECYYTLKIDYPKFVKSWDIEVSHITEMQDVLKIHRKETQNKAAHLKATFHDSCKLGRYFKKYDEPRILIRSLADVELIEIENNRENATCCGASPWIYCGSINKQIQDERLHQAGNTGADYLVTSCPKCQIHLTCAQRTDRSGGDQIKIIDIYHLVSSNLIPEENE